MAAWPDVGTIRLAHESLPRRVRLGTGALHAERAHRAARRSRSGGDHRPGGLAQVAFLARGEQVVFVGGSAGGDRYDMVDVQHDALRAARSAAVAATEPVALQDTEAQLRGDRITGSPDRRAGWPRWRGRGAPSLDPSQRRTGGPYRDGGRPAPSLHRPLRRRGRPRPPSFPGRTHATIGPRRRPPRDAAPRVSDHLRPRRCAPPAVAHDQQSPDHESKQSRLTIRPVIDRCQGLDGPQKQRQGKEPPETPQAAPHGRPGPLTRPPARPARSRPGGPAASGAHGGSSRGAPPGRARRGCRPCSGCVGRARRRPARGPARAGRSSRAGSPSARRRSLRRARARGRARSAGSDPEGGRLAGPEGGRLAGVEATDSGAARPGTAVQAAAIVGPGARGAPITDLAGP